MIKIKLLTILISISIAIASFAIPAQAQWLVNNAMESPYENLSIKIPGMKPFSKIYKDEANNSIKINWIGEYIVGIYNYAMGIIALIAMVTMAMGGVLWIVSAGDGSKISQAKSWITGSLTGLTLALCAYLMLGLINPDLVMIRPISLDMTGVEVGTAMAVEAEGDDPSLGTGGGNSPFTASDASKKATKELLETVGIDCDRDTNYNRGYPNKLYHNKSAIQGVTNQFRNNMVYRFGSKNGKGSDVKRGAVPDKKVAYDCSGFVNQVLWCAGFPVSPGEGTASIFRNAEKINDCNGNQINGLDVEAGDLLGWPPGNVQGHVLIYVGNGNMVDSHGTGTDGTMNSFGTFNMCDYYKNNPKKNWMIKRASTYQKFNN